MDEMTGNKKKGVVLIQIGTPESPEIADVKKFLNNFLMDPYVITIPWALRFVLVRGVIVPLRAAHSARLYHGVFTKNGSPLKHFLYSLAHSLETTLGPHFTVRPAMRHGSPSIQQALEEVLAAGTRVLTLIPLFPHATLSTTETILAACRQLIAQKWPALEVRTVAPFFANPEFIKALTDITTRSTTVTTEKHFVCSYHSVPLSHLKKTSHCSCHRSPTPTCEDPGCYHAGCLKTTKLLAERLGFDESRVHHTYQSQMGRASKWLGPSTHDLMSHLPGAGVKEIVVVCPGFLTSCLETIDEIGVRARDEFLAAGGKSFSFVPSLDDDPSWCRVLGNMVENGPFL